MAKSSIIYFLFPAILIVSCQQSSPQTVEQERFDKSLKQSSLAVPAQGLYTFVVWSENSCPNCKKSSAALVQAAKNEKVRLIIPPADESLIQTTDNKFVYVDTNRVFQKYYFGVSNIGLVVMKDGQTVSIKNYNTNEMDALGNDLDSIQRQ